MKKHVRLLIKRIFLSLLLLLFSCSGNTSTFISDSDDSADENVNYDIMADEDGLDESNSDDSDDRNDIEIMDISDQDNTDPDMDENADIDTFVPEVFPPEKVYFRTPTRSFNVKYYVALHEGQIWVKPNEEMTGNSGKWQLLGATGKPSGNKLPNFGIPYSIKELSADGVHLMAISDSGNFYRGSDMTTSIHDYFTWTDQWGNVGATGPGMITEFSTKSGWSVSDSHPFGVKQYEDPNDTVHSVGAGVAHIYRLSEDGYHLHFNDWWLPNDWSREICTPQRGIFKAVNISVSASTIFIIGENGKMYTRLYDFDTGGENSLLTYSYIVPVNSGTTRKLPAEPWLQQPEITDGYITKKITIFQNGVGNSARILRVEGMQDGVNGFFYKNINGADWTFQETELPVNLPFINDPDSANISPPIKPDDNFFSGIMSRNGQNLGIDFLDLNMVCSPGIVQLRYNGTLVTVSGNPLNLEFHHVNTMIDYNRPVHFWNQGLSAKVQVALLVPASIGQIDNTEAREFIVSFFDKRNVINFLGEMNSKQISFEEIMWDQPFLVPAEEKGFVWPFSISANVIP